MPKYRGVSALIEKSQVFFQYMMDVSWVAICHQSYLWGLWTGSQGLEVEKNLRISSLLSKHDVVLLASLHRDFQRELEQLEQFAECEAVGMSRLL